MNRLTRGLAALLLTMGTLTVGALAASASQGGDDHQVTLCHRTNSETNPYVEITVDKASVFKQGHDTHNEGGVHQPGDKANGVRWGDIIPPFDYFGSPKDEQTSHYAGLNFTAEGQAVLANGCVAPQVTTSPTPTPTDTTTPTPTPTNTASVTPPTTAPTATPTKPHKATHKPTPLPTTPTTTLPKTGAGPVVALGVLAVLLLAVGTFLRFTGRLPRRH